MLQKGSGKRARALFPGQESTPRSGDGCSKSSRLHHSSSEGSYEALLKNRNVLRTWGAGSASGPLLQASDLDESDCSFRKSSGSAWDCGLISDCGMMVDDGLKYLETPGPSLHDLCKLWDEECVDLVTRSLKYKSLMTDSNMLHQEVSNLG